MYPPGSRLKCGNICGERITMEGDAMALSATRAKALKDPGRYADGGGLHLYISKAGRKSWVQRITIDRRRRDIGLGAFPSVGLAQAREKAADNRTAVAEGRDPLAEKHSPAMPTFREAARAVPCGQQPPMAERPARGELAADPGASRHAGDRQHAPGPDRPRGSAAGPHPDMDDPSRDSAAGAATDADGLPLGDGARLSWGTTLREKPSTARCPRCRR